MMVDASPHECTGVAQSDTGLGLWTRARLSAARTAYAMGLRKLQDYLQAASPLSAGQDTCVCILGVQYPLHAESDPRHEAEAAAILQDCSSHVWLTYRKDFAGIGDTGLTSDVGWGCTLRSGQMLLAQALLLHSIGRAWRRYAPVTGQETYPEPLHRLLKWFWDSAQQPFSIHSLCQIGRPHGVHAGEWLGPWTLCHTLRDAVNRLRPGGMHVFVVSQQGCNGGGAPVLYRQELLDQLDCEHVDDAASLAPASAVLILVPLVLGVGKIDQRYVPQLKAVLSWPYSLGIVGGRPSASLYFIGHQRDHLLYLDPHDVQQVSAEAGDASSCWCSEMRSMAAANIDPSIAVGFLCQSRGDAEALCGKLAQLETTAGGAPLLSVADGQPPDWAAAEAASEHQVAVEANDWEML